MKTIMFRKKTSLWERLGYIVMMFLSTLFLFQFAISISQRGLARDLNDWLKPMMYAFIVITYVYFFWRLCKRIRTKAVATTLAVICACLCFVQILAYNSFLHLIPWAQYYNFDKYELLNALPGYMRGDLTYSIGDGALRYPALAIAVLVPCLAIAIKTPNGICHLIHEIKMKILLFKKEGPAAHRITNLPAHFISQGAFIEKFTLDGNMSVSMQNADDTFIESGDVEYTVLFKAIDHTDSSDFDQYVVFYNAANFYDSDDTEIIYAAKYDKCKKHPLLRPVDNQNMLDFLESKFILNWN